jgi:hypothetical protein
METPVHHWPAPLVDPIHRAREPHGHALHSARERPRSRRLHQEMNVIVLDRILNDPEVAALRASTEAALERADKPNDSQ